MTRDEVLTNMLPYGLGHIVESSYVQIKRDMGWSEAEIWHSLHVTDVASEFEWRSPSGVVCGMMTWSDSREGHEFWEEIFNKLKQIEER